MYVESYYANNGITKQRVQKRQQIKQKQMPESGKQQIQRPLQRLQY